MSKNYRAYDVVTEWLGPPRETPEQAAKDATRHNRGAAVQGGYGSAEVVRRGEADRLYDLSGKPVWPPHGHSTGAARWRNPSQALDWARFSNPTSRISNPPSDLKVEWSQMGGVSSVVGPAYKMIQLPVGAEGKYGPITKYTSDWARIGYVKLADSVKMDRPRQSGHEIEGRVSIKGKKYSAFTSGGENPDGGDGMIVVRTRP